MCNHVYLSTFHSIFNIDCHANKILFNTIVDIHKKETKEQVFVIQFRPKVKRNRNV